MWSKLTGPSKDYDFVQLYFSLDWKEWLWIFFIISRVVNYSDADMCA